MIPNPLFPYFCDKNEESIASDNTLYIGQTKNNKKKIKNSLCLFRQLH
jgi:hypothetical protein